MMKQRISIFLLFTLLLFANGYAQKGNWRRYWLAILWASLLLVAEDMVFMNVLPVTMMRLNLVKGLGPVLQLAEGWTVDIDPEIHNILNMPIQIC